MESASADGTSVVTGCLRNCLPANCPASPHHRESHHPQKDRQQPKRGGPNIIRPFRQNRQSPVHELDVHPVNKQGSLAKLNERTESTRAESPSAPRITQEGNDEQQPHPHQKEIRTRVP